MLPEQKALIALISTDEYNKLSPEEVVEKLNKTIVEAKVSTFVELAEFVAKFTADEYVDLIDSNDPELRHKLEIVWLTRRPVDLSGALVTSVINRAADLGILDKSRVQEITESGRVVKMTLREQLGWPNDTIWPSDIQAARKMSNEQHLAAHAGTG